MPTVIALDVSLSMTRPIPNQSKTAGTSGDGGGSENTLTYHQVAVKGINYILDYLTKHAKLEFVSLVSIENQYPEAFVYIDSSGVCFRLKERRYRVKNTKKKNREFVFEWGSGAPA
ncbi:AGAP007540-PA-like protein [Anopheles sinensis]|uniref:AGAP007540-PA-like protein n=1 Tax=Anopheles sinensis TaxID=74873 RepID=A0A084WNH2_ANOSI|nr:AGAP007540-PA-like protein [Anopheles sinensis]